MINLDNAKNQYELRKTIRFVLEPKNAQSFYKPNNSFYDLNELLKDFSKEYKLAIEDLKKLIFKTQDNKEISLNREIKVKHCWLRNYTKNQFYEIKDKLKGNQTLIDDKNLKFLKEYFSDWIKENKECADNLANYLNKPEEEQERKSEFAYWIKRILKRSNFEAIFELFNGNIQNKESDENVVLVKEKLDKLKELLKEIEKQLLPSQSLGLQIEQATFNYYTVNKKQKSYSKEIEDKINLLSEEYNFEQQAIKFFNEVDFDYNLPVSDLKESMKKFKADQKSRFYELTNQKKSYADLTQDPSLKLMNDIPEEKFKSFCKEKSKQKRGKYFQFHFKKYKKFLKIYEGFSKYFGDIKAEIKALQKEKIDAERLKSWALILEKDSQKYILTIPRDANDNLQTSKKFIDNIQCQENGEWKLHSFESLTLGALSKLCFGMNKNTFIPEIKNELKHKNQDFFKNEKGEQKLKRKDQFSDDGKELIKFYQAALRLKKTKELLKIENFDGLAETLEKTYENQTDFEKDLKQACYFKKTQTISEEIKEQLVKDFQGTLYKITSYDLQKDDPEILENLENKQLLERNNPEIHTKYWLDFWTRENASQKYEIRLNPEFKINFVEKIKYELKNPDQPQPRNNRKMKDRYLLSTTITLNAHEKNSDLAFKKTDEIVGFIEKYNLEFNQKIGNPFDLYYYGIDRGQEELATLGLFKFSENEKIQFVDQKGNGDEYHKPEFIDLELYEIRNLKATKQLEKTKEKVIAYKSPSEFIDDLGVIGKIQKQSCFDLSCAKLIKDKIVINGDIATYLKSKEISAKRAIWEGFSKNEFKSDQISFDEDKRALFLKIENRGKLENKNLYYYNEKFEKFLPLDQIKTGLQKYYDDLKNKNQDVQIITIDKINNLRDALCSNVVGIINHLQKKYPGIICLEDLDINNKNKRINENSSHFGSRIEFKLLQKFQTLSLVPPVYKQAMSLQSKKQITQLGIISYIETAGTSGKCPNCTTDNSDKSNKWENHSYKCVNQNCGFDSSDKTKRKGLDAIDNSDSVATFNIAKRGLENFINQNKNNE